MSDRDLTAQSSKLSNSRESCDESANVLSSLESAAAAAQRAPARVYEGVGVGFDILEMQFNDRSWGFDSGVDGDGDVDRIVNC